MLITFEGLDGCGKTTQAQRLVDRLGQENAHPPVYLIREPGGTAVSEKIRELLLSRQHDELTNRAELLLFSASRAQLVAERIRPALDTGAFVVCDRFYDSTTAYQGYGRGLDQETIAVVNRFATLGVVPDVSFFIDIPIDEIDRRKEIAGVPQDRMETSGIRFYENVRKGYLEIARSESGRFVVIDGVAARETIESAIWSEVQARRRKL